MTDSGLDAELAAREVEILPHRMKLERALGRILTEGEQFAHRIGFMDGKNAGLQAAIEELASKVDLV